MVENSSYYSHILQDNVFKYTKKKAKGRMSVVIWTTTVELEGHTVY